MSATTVPNAPVRDASWQRGAPLRVARLGLRAGLLTWAGFWATVALVVVVLTTVLVRVGELPGSTLGLVGAAPRWFGFTMLVVTVAGGVGPFVAQGLTRRAVVELAAVVTLATAVATTVVWVALNLLEHAVFRAQGWPTSVEGHAYTDSGQLAPLALEMLLAMLVYGASGALVAATYYRAGGWWGTLALPLTVGPAILADTLVSTAWQGMVSDEWQVRLLVDGVAAPVAVRVLVALLLAAALLAAFRLVLRGASVRRPAS